jgi:DNA-binding response OmpR family regulator
MKMNNKNELNISELYFHQALYLLRVLYSKIINILEASFGSVYAFRNAELNMFYTIFLEIVNDILKLKGFEELREGRPVLIESLVGDIEEFGDAWDIQISKLAYDFLGNIEKVYIISGVKTFKLPKTIEDSLLAVDKIIEEHKKENELLFKGVVKTKRDNLKGSIKQQKKSDEIPSEDKSKTEVSDDKGLKCGELVLNMSEATLKYKNHKISISPGKNAIKFLELLMSYKWLEYKEIARKLYLPCFSEKKSNEDVAETIRYQKSHLNTELKKSGLSDKETKEICDMIVAETNIGYRFQCND